MTEPIKRPPGRPRIGSERKQQQNISIDPADLAELAKISSNISEAFRHVMKIYKENNHHG